MIRADGRELAPLRGWGDEIRRRRHVARRRWRLGAAGVAAIGCLLGGFGETPMLLWNATASAPIGLYRVSPGGPIARGHMVAVRMPARFRSFAAERDYVPETVPLVKRVVGVPGDVVCGVGRSITLDGGLILERRLHDGAGRAMPSWQGCVTLDAGHLFVAMPDVATSFDGRYFGVSDARDVVGKVDLLWAR